MKGVLQVVIVIALLYLLYTAVQSEQLYSPAAAGSVSQVNDARQRMYVKDDQGYSISDFDYGTVLQGNHLPTGQHTYL